MDRATQIVQDRNRLLVKLLWVFYLIDMVKFLLDDRPSPTVAIMGLVILSLLTWAAWKGLHPNLVMYLIIGSTFLFFFALMTVSPYLVNYVFIWFGLVLSAVYQSCRAVLYAGSLCTAMTVFFFYKFRSTLIPEATPTDVIYPLMFSLFVTTFLLYLTKFTRNLWMEAEENRERLQYMAYHDALTELPNRVLFSELAAGVLARGKRDQGRIAVMFFDLSGFKEVNDTFGHDVGDVLLREVAKRLRNGLREADTLCRLGGDEFIALLEINSPDDIAVIAGRVSEMFALAFSAGGIECSVDCSIGVSLYPEHGQDLETLIRNADSAMYKAKSRGGTTWHVSGQADELAPAMKAGNR